MNKLSKYSMILVGLFLLVMISPLVQFDKTNGVEVEYSTVLASPDSDTQEIFGDDYEYAEEHPEVWDAGCAVLCYGPGSGCEDWTGTGDGYETGGC
jgi:hypothetical protein